MDRVSLVKKEHGRLVMFIASTKREAIPEEVKEIVTTQNLDRMRDLAKAYIDKVSRGGDRSFLRPMQEIFCLIECAQNFNKD